MISLVITRCCCSSSCVRRAKAGRDNAVYEIAWPILSSPLLLCSYKAPWNEGLWKCEFLNLYILYTHQEHGFSMVCMVVPCFFFFFCVLQSLLMVIVGFTFSDDQVPTDFIPYWYDWLGETLESVQVWQTGPFHQHLPAQKGIFQKLFTFLQSLHALHKTGPMSVLSMFAQRMSSTKISRFFHPPSQLSFWKLFHLTFGKEEK